MIAGLSRVLGLHISEETFQIRAEQIRTLVKAYPSMITANVVMAPLVAWLMWNKIEHGILLSWVSLLYVFHALEIRHWLNYPKVINSIDECKRWQRQFLLSDGLVGAAWGSAGIFMFVPNDPLSQAFLLCIMVGMASAAVAGNLVFPLSQQTYVAFVILPILFNILNQGTPEYYLLGVMVGVFLIFVMKVGRDQSKFFELSIRRGFENTELVSQLKYQRDRIQHYLDVTPALMIELDCDGRITMVNRATEDLLGYCENELLGRNWFELCPLKAEREAVLLPIFRSIVAGEIKSSAEYEHSVMCRDGRHLVIACRSTELDDADGRFSGVLSSGMDITARKQSDELRLNALRKLEDKELSKTRFLAAAGHDLRQPVAAANLFVDSLKLTSPTPRQNALIERLDQSMSTFSNMLERLLDISKFDAGLIESQPTAFNLAELINWLEQNISQTAYEKNLQFRVFLPKGKPLVVYSDRGLLQSVVMNLVTNAIKFTQEGGVLVSARVHAGKVRLQVWDTGIGIADADIGRIFDEFIQVANPQRNREAGLGLGLSICQRAMALLGGEIICRSRLGRGTVFEIGIPLNGELKNTDTQSIDNLPLTLIADSAMIGKRVVVLEDDALVAAGMIDLMQTLGAEVRHFRDAEVALRHIDIDSTDIFIVDYSLDGSLSGLQFLQAMQEKSLKSIRALIVTGETSSDFMKNMRQSPWPVFHKPINYAKLASHLGD